MSLRVRLVLLIVALVALVAMAISAVHLATLANLQATGVLENSRLAADQAKAFVTDRVNQNPDPSLWTGIVSSDAEIPRMFEKMLKLSTAIRDINIAGPSGKSWRRRTRSRPGRISCRCRRSPNGARGLFIRACWI